jgi:group I intron endonuclease
MFTGIIYKLTVISENTSYIGQTVNSLEERWWGHVALANAGGEYPLSRAIRKYGSNGFLKEILTTVTAETIEELKINLNKMEISLIKEHNTRIPFGYNLTDGGEGCLGYKHPEEFKSKISKLMSGRKLTPEQIQRMSEVRIGKSHGPHSEETRRKIGEANRRRIVTEETKKKLSEYFRGRKQSDEAKLKMSLASKGKPKSEEHRNNISKGRTGIKVGPLSDAHKEKLRIAGTGRKQSEETKRKRSETMKKLWKLRKSTSSHTSEDS